MVLVIFNLNRNTRAQQNYPQRVSARNRKLALSKHMVTRSHSAQLLVSNPEKLSILRD